MEDNFTNQEEHLRSLSENFSLEIDTSELWDNIESQLPPVQKERKRPVIWWFASGALLVLMTILLWNNQSKTSQNDAIADAITESTVPTSYNHSIYSETKHIQNSPSIKNAKVSTDVNQNSETAKTLNNPKSNQKNTEITKENFTPIFNSNRYDEKSTPRKEGLIDRRPILQNADKALIDPFSNIIDKQELENKNETRAMISFASLNSVSLNTLQKDSEFDFPSMMIKPIRKTTWLPYYALTSGANMHRANIYSNAPEGLNQKLFENERPLLGYTSDFNFGYESNNGWRFGFGLNYNRIVSGFSQIETDTIVSSIEGNPSSKIDDEGNVSYLSGTVLETSIINYDLNWHRKHDIVNAQLSIGKRILRKGKLSIFTDATLGRSIWSKHSGYYFTEGSKSITKFESNENNPYSNAGYNAGLSMDVEYEINRVSITLKPFAKMGLNSITQNSNYYQLKNSLYGIQLGIVYRP